MVIVAVGMSHQTAPISALENVALTPDQTIGFLNRVMGAEHLDEVAVLATCNRMEVYAEAPETTSGLAALIRELSGVARLPADEVLSYLRIWEDHEAVKHLFRVACGLDSMLVGEGQIRGQVRAAYQVAQKHGSIGRVLHDLFQQALRVGKRAEAELGLAQAAPSLLDVGLETARQVLGSLDDRAVLVIGAGNMGGLAAAALRREAVRELTIVSRSVESAERLAQRLDPPARVIPMAVLAEALADSDLVVTGTASTEVILTRELMRSVQQRREGKAMVVLDIALPRDTDPGIAELPGVSLVDLDVLNARLRGHSWQLPIDTAAKIVEEEASAYVKKQRIASVAPAISALRQRATDVVAEEIGRLRDRVPALPVHVGHEVERTAHRIADKILHPPTVQARRLAAESADSDRIELIRELFMPDDDAAT